MTPPTVFSPANLPAAQGKAAPIIGLTKPNSKLLVHRSSFSQLQRVKRRLTSQAQSQS